MKRFIIITSFLLSTAMFLIGYYLVKDLAYWAAAASGVFVFLNIVAYGLQIKSTCSIPYSTCAEEDIVNGRRNDGRPI